MSERQPRSLKALLFDLDGTLLDTAPDLVASVNHVRAEIFSLPPITAEQLRPVVGKGSAAMLKLATPLSEAGTELKRCQALMLDYYAANLINETKPFPGISQLLDYLDETDGIRWGIVTNKPSRFTLPILHGLCLSERAACVVCADMVEAPKPAPDALLFAANALQLPTESCAYLGDANSDMEAAQSAQMCAIAAEWGYIESSEKLDDWPFEARFSTPKQVLQWIAN
ncbi:MAG: HAD-IA family hydrolase [Pseudomonadota bacterium]